MKTRLTLLLLALGMGAAQAAEWRVVLLKPPGCTSCMFVEELLKRRTRNYAKRQLTWFRPDPRIRWLEPEGMIPQFLSMIREDF